MFKMIGIVVVAFVAYVGWGAISDFWKGDMSAEEAATVIRKDVGSAISNSNPRKADDQSAASAGDDKNKAQTIEPKNAEQILDQMMKR
jgi:hypothetical protein